MFVDTRHWENKYLNPFMNIVSKQLAVFHTGTL